MPVQLVGRKRPSEKMSVRVTAQKPQGFSPGGVSQSLVSDHGTITAVPPDNEPGF